MEINSLPRLPKPSKESGKFKFTSVYDPINIKQPTVEDNSPKLDLTDLLENYSKNSSNEHDDIMTEIGISQLLFLLPFI